MPAREDAKTQVSYSQGVISQPASGAKRRRTDVRLLALLICLSLVASLGTLWAVPREQASLFQLGNLVGPTAESLLHGGGLTACTIAQGTLGNPICFHAGRMPFGSTFVAAGAVLLGDHVLPVDVLKTVLLLVPVELSVGLVWLRLPAGKPRRWLIAALLLLPFGMTPFLADVTNLQVEEGYSYSLIAFAVAVLLFAVPRMGERGLGWAVAFALAVDGVYLAKSSMAPAVAVLVVSYLLQRRSVAERMLVLALVLAAPMGWALHQHHASGRYSLGTSLDGMNLHKGNNPPFLEHYPPAVGDTLDWYDPQLNRGVFFKDEWSFNDYHQRSAVSYLREHPRETLVGWGRKLAMIFLSVRKSGSGESHGVRLAIEDAGLVLFRLILWTALGVSMYEMLSGRGRDGLRARGAGADRPVAAGTFLALVAAIALPYMLGFAYTRHISVLIYPSVLLCCRFLEV